jgi:hypothetical protein
MVSFKIRRLIWQIYNTVYQQNIMYVIFTKNAIFVTSKQLQRFQHGRTQ